MKYIQQVSQLVFVAGLLVLSACGGGGGGYERNTAPSSSSSSVSSVASSSSSLSSSSSSVANIEYLTGLYTLVDFPIGVAVPSTVLTSQIRTDVVDHYFSEITAENAMKPQYLHPAEDLYTFDDADALIDWATAIGKQVHGHTLVWHQQIPNWMVNYQGSAADWEAMMEDHVTTVATHFRGSVESWDVVNEAIDDAGGFRDSVWYQGFGNESYIEKAFLAAREADPDALLYYNDYNLSADGAKMDTLDAMLTDFKARNIPIDGVGFQMHVTLDYPSIQAMQSAWAKVVNHKLKVKLTELDVKVGSESDPYVVLPAEIEAQQAARYQAIIEAYLTTVPAEQLGFVSRGGITVWGINDGDSWKSSQWPLLFNDDFTYKQALPAFIDALTP